ILVESHYTPTVAPSTSQPHHLPTLKDFIRQETKVPPPSSPTQTHVSDETASTGQDSDNIHKTPTMAYDSPLPRVHTLGSDEGIMKHNELMDLVTKLTNRVVALETDLQQTKKVYGTAFTKLIKKGRHEHDMEPDFEFTAPEEVYTTKKELVLLNQFPLLVHQLTLMKKKGRGLSGYKKKQALSTLKNGITFKIELKLMKSLHRDYNQRKERCTLKLKKQGCLQSLSMRERNTLLHKELKKGGTSHSHKLNKGLTSTMRRVHTFVPMESESERVIPELAAGSFKRDAEEEHIQKSLKRQKTRESSEPVEEPKDKEEEELSQEMIQKIMIIVPEQGMNVEALQTKYPIIDWEIYTKGARKYWKIIRVGNHTEVYQFFDDMLKAFDREDLVNVTPCNFRNFR
ncbi:hypothetical protein Tco_1512620, partial [Tanacetum coccineum]